jgi:hypothetical protein
MPYGCNDSLRCAQLIGVEERVQMRLTELSGHGCR